MTTRNVMLQDNIQSYVECIDERPCIRLIQRTTVITILLNITSVTFSCYLASSAMFACLACQLSAINKQSSK